MTWETCSTCDGTGQEPGRWDGDLSPHPLIWRRCPGCEGSKVQRRTACTVDVDASCPKCRHRTGVHLAVSDADVMGMRCLPRGCDCDATLEQLGCACR